MRKLLILFLILVLIMAIGFGDTVEGAKFKIKDLGKKKFYKNAAKSVAKTVQKSKVYKATGVNKYLAPAKKKKKPKKKKQIFNLKPTASADYTDNVIPPYTGDKFTLIKADVDEYAKALDGKESKKLVSPPPIGKQYFYNTGVKCADIKTGEFVDRYSIIDSRVGIKRDDGTIDNSIFASAVADFNRSTIFRKQPNYEETLADKCVKITIEPVDVYGKKLKPETQYVSVIDIQKFDDMQQGPKEEGPGGKGSIGENTTKGNEGFVSSINMEKMNTGQQVFIYSASGLGLYLLFKAYHKI
jgi:hypothetical protein